ncbi:MAG: PA2779 family protein [Burkholderiales bacterium]|nr:PA2779 family protein [Burkholderiales bacterium]
MNAAMNRLACALLALVVAVLPMQPANAGMIGTDSAVAAAQQPGDRERVEQFFSRADVKAQLERFGVSPADASDRVGLLSEAELQRLAGQIENAPAGAIGTLVIIVLLGILVWALVVR